MSLRTDDSGAWLHLRPCVPAAWTAFHVDYRYRGTMYNIDIEMVDEQAVSIDVDGELQAGPALALVDDGRPHAVRVRLGRLGCHTAAPDDALRLTPDPAPTAADPAWAAAP